MNIENIIELIYSSKLFLKVFIIKEFSSLFIKEDLKNLIIMQSNYNYDCDFGVNNKQTNDNR